MIETMENISIPRGILMFCLLQKTAVFLQQAKHQFFESTDFYEIQRNFIEVSGFWQPLVVALGIHARIEDFHNFFPIFTGI